VVGGNIVYVLFIPSLSAPVVPLAIASELTWVMCR
jgi:hypothetical protein